MIDHEDFCPSRWASTTPRTETYSAERTAPDGTVTSRPTVNRCVDCGAQTVIG